MPIRGLSNILRLPRRGKIHLGEKRIHPKTGNEYCVAFDYFVLPEEVKALYKGKTNRLDIMLPMEDRNVFFPQYYKRYGKNERTICRGN